MNTRLRCPWRCSPVRTSVICLRCWNGRFLTSEATGVEHLRFHSPPPSYATAWTHLPEGGYRSSNPRLDCRQSETVKLRTVARAKYLQGISAISASDLPVTGLQLQNLVSINFCIFYNFCYPF